MAAYPNGYKGADLKSAVWACIPPGRSNRSAVVLLEHVGRRIVLKMFAREERSNTLGV